METLTRKYQQDLSIDGWFDIFEDFSDSSRGEGDSYDPPVYARYSQSDIDLFEQSICRSAFVHDTDAWIALLRQGNEAPIIAMLLLLLGNLSVCSI